MPLYNRNAASEYAEKYALVPNTAQYPLYIENDCANFISQVLAAGGMPQVHSGWENLNSWFCATNNPKALTQTAITWRAARYFRRHWGRENNIGIQRASIYMEMTAAQALQRFDQLYTMLQEGDVVQHGNPQKQNLPYHTQVIHRKGFNAFLFQDDLFMAQHSRNAKNVSLYTYLSNLPEKSIRAVYIYKIQ